MIKKRNHVIGGKGTVPEISPAVLPLYLGNRDVFLKSVESPPFGHWMLFPKWSDNL